MHATNNSVEKWEACSYRSIKLYKKNISSKETSKGLLHTCTLDSENPHPNTENSECLAHHKCPIESNIGAWGWFTVKPLYKSHACKEQLATHEMLGWLCYFYHWLVFSYKRHAHVGIYVSTIYTKLKSLTQKWPTPWTPTSKLIYFANALSTPTSWCASSYTGRWINGIQLRTAV